MISLNKLWPRALSAAAFLVALAAPIGALTEQVWFAPPDNLQRSTRTVLSSSIRPPPGAGKPMSSSFHHSWAVSSVLGMRFKRQTPFSPLTTSPWRWASARLRWTTPIERRENAVLGSRASIVLAGTPRVSNGSRLTAARADRSQVMRRGRRLPARR
jgi:hypothetical protein